MPDDSVTRREIDQLLAIGKAAGDSREAAIDERWNAHRREHGAESNERQIIDAARGAAHDERWVAHRREHDMLMEAQQAADASTDEKVRLALEDHHRQHLVHETAHDREHQFTETALGKAETATEKRFESVNEFRAQLADVMRTLASKDSVDITNKEMARRFEELRIANDQRFEASRASVEQRFESNRAAIVELQKLDVKAEGKGIGQSAVFGWIVGGVGFLTAVIALYNTLPA